MAAATVEVLFGRAKGRKALESNPSTKKVPMVGNQHLGAPGSKETLPDEPSHEERIHQAAADEHVHAHREYAAGRISSKEFAERKRRAEGIMAKTPKMGAKRAGSKRGAF